MNIFLLIFIIFILIIVLSFFYNGFFLAPWVPTRKKDLERINKIIKIKPGQTLLEMGCGDGKVCSYIGKNNPDSKIIGIEISIGLFIFAKIRNILFGPKNLKIFFGNAFKEDFSKFDFIYIYGLPKFLNKEVKEKAEKEMKKGGKIISYEFEIKNWKGKIFKDENNGKGKKITTYIK